MLTIYNSNYIESLKIRDIELSEIDAAELIESEQHKHDRRVKELERAINDLKNKGVKLPEIDILAWPELEDNLVEGNILMGVPIPPKPLTRSELGPHEKLSNIQSPVIILDKFEKSFLRIRSALYAHDEFLELHAKLPDSCPNKTGCFDIFKTREERNHPCFDYKHPYHSSDLLLTIKCWEALFICGEYKEEKKSPKKQIKNWLNQNGGSLAKETVERVATLLNPDKLKKGGASKTGKTA